MPRKCKFAECYGPGVLVQVFALEARMGPAASALIGDWTREATVQGRGMADTWVFFTPPYTFRETGDYQAYEKYKEEKRVQVTAMRDWLKLREVPVVLWCQDWGTPVAPTAPPPKGKKVKPHKAFDRAVRELKRAIKADRAYIKETLDETAEQAEQAEEEGFPLEEYPGYVGCLDPTTGVVYEAGIEWSQYFQGCGGPGPWNAIVSFHMDLEDPKDMLEAVVGTVGEAFDAAGVEY